MDTHDDTHEKWLVQILAGESVSSEVRSITGNCSECATALRDVEALSATLDRAGELERRTLTAPEVSDIRQRELALADGASRRRPVALWVRIAAGLLVLSGLFLGLREAIEGGTRDPGPTMRGDHAARMMPRGEVDSVTHFESDVAAPPGGSLEIRVYDPARGNALVLKSPPLLEPRWTPNANELRALPTAFRWDIVSIDSTGNRGERTSADVTVRSR